MWALGLILYYMASGQELFKESDHKDAMNSILNVNNLLFSLVNNTSIFPRIQANLLNK